METRELVGRRDESATLERALADATEGRPQLLLLSGEAGVGKTRLVDELCRTAEAGRTMVFRGRAREDPYATFQPFAEVVRAQLRAAPEALERLLGAEVERLRELARGESLQRAESALESRPQQQLLLHSAVTRAACELARLRPCVLAIDDLHWADGPSLEQLQHLVFSAADASQGDPLRLLVIATLRPPDPDEPLARVLTRLDREPIARSLPLGELTEAAVAELIEDVAGREPTKQLVGDVRAIAGGNPLFVQATVTALQSLGALSVSGGFATLAREIDQLDLPRDLLGAPATNLGERCRALLTFAATCGDDFEPRELAELLQLSVDDVVELAEEGRRAGLLVWDGETFRFRHPLVRQSLYHVAGPLERQRVHIEIAGRLEKRSESPSARESLRIAHHLARATSLCEPDRLANAAERAADCAFAQGSWQHAARLFAAAARALERPGDGDASRIARLHFGAGLAHYRNMDVGPAAEHYARAIERLGPAGDPALRAQALVEQTRTRLTTGEGAFAGTDNTRPLEDALEALGEREPLRRGQLCHMLAEACWTGGDPDQAVAWAERGVDIARSHDAPVLLSQCLTSLGMAQSNQLRLVEARRSLEEAASAAERSGDRWTQGQPLQRLPLVLVWLGRLAEAERIAQEACRVTRETQDWAEHSLGLATLTLLAVIRGRFADAEREAAEAFRTTRRAHYPWGAVLALAAVASSRTLSGEPEAAERALDQTAGRSGAFSDAGPALAFLGTVYRQLIASQRGDAPGEAPLAVQLLADNPELRPDMQVLGALCAGAETARNRGDAALAARCYHLIAQAGERGVLFPSGWVFLVPRVLGVAAAENGWWDRAEEHFLAAAAAAEAAGASPELALTALDHAAMHLARGSDGDAEHAATLLERADAIAQDLEMDAVIDRIASVATRAGIRLRREGHWRGLDPRKQDRQMASGGVDRVLFVSDMEGFTTLFERFGDEATEAIVDRHNVILRACLREYGGREVQHTGDGVIASFTSVDRALACAVAMQRDLAIYNDANPERPIRVRMGVHRGRTTPVEDRLIGAAVNATVRIANAARAGEIYVSDEIRAACDAERFRTADRGEHTLKGFSAPLHLHELLWSN